MRSWAKWEPPLYPFSVVRIAVLQAVRIPAASMDRIWVWLWPLTKSKSPALGGA